MALLAIPPPPDVMATVSLAVARLASAPDLRMTVQIFFGVSYERKHVWTDSWISNPAACVALQVTTSDCLRVAVVPFELDAPMNFEEVNMDVLYAEPTASTWRVKFHRAEDAVLFSGGWVGGCWVGWWPSSFVFSVGRRRPRIIARRARVVNPRCRSSQRSSTSSAA